MMGKRMRGWKRRAAAALAALIAAGLLGGCGAAGTLGTGKGEKEYGRPETMVIMTTERSRYEEVYSEEIWTAAADGQKTTFDAALTDQIHDFLRELKTMSLMAEEKEIVLSSREKELAKTAAARYMENLGETLAAEMGVTGERAEALFTDYWVSWKLVEHITGDMNLEVSDSEARVMTMDEIAVSDQAKAEEALAELQAGGDFSAVARAYSGSPESRTQIWRGLRGEEYEEAAFSMETGDISGILEDGGEYYILKCVSDYDEEATRKRKEQMVRDKKNQAFYESYAAFQAEHPLAGDAGLWEGLAVSQCPLTEADFFEIFSEVCAGEEAL